jgi:hypothetical protein
MYRGLIGGDIIVMRSRKGKGEIRRQKDTKGKGTSDITTERAL